MMTMAFPKELLPASPLTAASSTARPEQRIIRKNKTPKILRLANRSRGFMLPTTMPVIIMLSGPIMPATSLKATAAGSGSETPANSRSRPNRTARILGFSSTFFRLKALSWSNMRMPIVQNMTLKTRI